MAMPEQVAATATSSSAATVSLRRFVTLWSAQALSLLGTQVAQFALVWWLARETGSAAVMTGATMIALLPPVIGGPFVGALVDRHSRKRLMLAADIAAATVSLLLALAFHLGHGRLALVLGALLAQAVAASVHLPAMLAATTLLVPREHLARVQGAQQGLRAGLQVVSAPLGAVALTHLPLAGILLADMASAAVAITTLLWTPVPEPAETSRLIGHRENFAAAMRAGIALLRSQRGLQLLIALAALVNIAVVPALSLLPLLAVRHLGPEPALLAGLSSAFGLGALGGGLLMAIWGGFERKLLTAFSALMVMGAAVATLGLATPSLYPVLISAATLLGASAPCVNGPIQAVVQGVVAPQFQGRIFTLMGSGAAAATPIGLALAGPVAEILGVRAWYLAGGAACAVSGVVGLSVSAERFFAASAARKAGPFEAPAPAADGGHRGSR